MLKAISRVALIIFFILPPLFSVYAQQMPPAQVVVSKVRSGMVAPENEFIGTVYYQEVSDIASEISGKVESVDFEEGQRVKKGEVLVRLSSDLLEKSLNATKASYEEVISELEKAERELKRAENLYKEELISEQIYDDKRFRVIGLKKKVASLKAEVERIEIELEKKTIKAPYDGIVIKKHVNRGEWVSVGSPVATIAKDDIVDIIVEVPEKIIRYVTRGMVVNIKAGGEVTRGKVFAIIPKGDISTRTIPVKIRVKNSLSLIEGMQAGVSLPAGKKRKVFIVARDAIINMFGTDAVFAVIDSKAKMIPVKVIGYKGMDAGIYAKGLSEGMSVVIEGNERLRDGQTIKINSKLQAPNNK